MGDVMLPASPNWYCSRVSDCSGDGLFVFGAKNCLYILDTTSNPARFGGRVTVHGEAGERVVGVSLCRGSERLQAATAGEDGRVRVWDLTAKPPSLLDEHANHKNKPTTVHWSPKDPNIIVSGDEKGGLVVWRLARQEVRQFTPENCPIFSLECSPHDSALLAVGYKTGLILIVDISGHGVVQHRLRGHDDEVHCVTWCPSLGEDIRQRTEWDDPEVEAPAQGECLLASGSRDRTIRLWSISKGRGLLTLKVGTPGMPGHRRDRYDNSQKVRLWMTLIWHRGQPNHIISSSQSGELLLWDLCRPGKQKCDILVPAGTSRGHQRIVFNICSGDAAGEQLVTISMDRQVLVWELSTMKVQNIPTLGGFSYCLAQSPVNPGRLAVGVGDNMIRVWNTDNPTHPYDVTILWQGIKAKVTTLCWHPQKEGLLAYGTDDGRVGIYDVLSNRPPQISETYHKKTVYVVTWGPSCHDNKGPNEHWMVYSCGDGVILQHNPSHLDRDAKNFNRLVDKSDKPQGRAASRSEISWKADFTAVALGNEDGSIDVYRAPKLQLLCVIQVHRKLINVIRWHPLYTGATTQPSPCQHWLASGSNEAIIHVCDLGSCFASASDQVAMVTDSFCSLEGHSNRITGLAWSWHEDGKIASASYDHTAQVWNVKAGGTPVANFRGHVGRLLSVAWSHSDPDVVYSGGDDFTVQTWNVSAQLHAAPPKGAERRKLKKNKSRGKSKDVGASPEAVTSEPMALIGGDVSMVTGSEMDELQAMLEEKKRQLSSAAGNWRTDAGRSDAKTDGGRRDGNVCSSSPDSAAAASEPGHVTRSDPWRPQMEAEDFSPEPLKRERRDHKKRRVKSMFPVFSSKENRGKGALLQDCSDLAKVMYADKTGGSPAEFDDSQRHLGMYSNRRNLYALLQQESEHHEEQGNIEQQIMIDMWTGDIGTTLDKAADRGRLNDWLMALAPLVSPSKWRHLCGVYAKQLEIEGNIHKSATYLLSGGNVDEAIALLRRHLLFREAVSLARVRLSPHDPILADLYMAWGDQLAKDHAYEQAAKCYLAVRQPLEAAKTLARRVDPLALQTAVHVTLLANEMTACKAYGQKFIHDCELRGDWAAAAEVSGWHDVFKTEALVVRVHEILVQELTKLDLYQGHDLETCVTSQGSGNDRAGCTADLLPKFLLNPEKADPVSLWEPVLVEFEAMVLAVVRCWLSYCGLDLHATPLNALYLELSKLKQTNQCHSSEKQVLLHVALDVTLGILSLLQCNTEMAAYWWVVAMDVCRETNHYRLQKGLCRLLLPQGPPSLAVLQKQLTAVRMAVVEDHLGTGPAPFFKPHHSMPDIIVTEPSNRLEMHQVSNPSEQCSAVNCLMAFYYRIVLEELTSSLKSGTGVSTTDDSDQTAVDTKSCSVAMETSVCSATSNESEPKEYDRLEKNDIQSRSAAFSKHQMSLLSLGLLWDVHVLKNYLRAALIIIESVGKSSHCDLGMSEATTATLGDRDQGGSNVKTFSQGLLSCSSLPNIVRSPSGEYLYMKPGGSTEPTEDEGDAKCTFTIGTGSDSDDDTLENGDDEPIDISKVRFNNELPKRRPGRSYSVDVAGFSLELSAQLRLSGESKMDDRPKRHVRDHSLEDIPERKEEKCEDPSGAENLPGVLPEGWDEMPLDKKYNIEGMSLGMLTKEKQRCSDRLLSLSSRVMSCPFPFPLESARRFVQLQDVTPGAASICHLVALWAKDRAYLSSDKDYFATKAEELSVKTSTYLETNHVRHNEEDS